MCDLGHFSQILNLIIFITEHRMIKSLDLQQAQFLLILILLHSKFGVIRMKKLKRVVSLGFFNSQIIPFPAHHRQHRKSISKTPFRGGTIYRRVTKSNYFEKFNIIRTLQGQFNGGFNAQKRLTLILIMEDCTT